MDNTIAIKFNDSQYHFLSELSEDQYRTPEELVALLIAEGFNFYRETVDFCVKKLETDRDPEGKEFQWYEPEDQKTLFKNLVFQQREASN